MYICVGVSFVIVLSTVLAIISCTSQTTNNSTDADEYINICRFAKDNVVLYGVWTGYGGKPDWTRFLGPVMDDVSEMTVMGRKVKFDFAVADLPAKANLLNIIQFNGRYGCSLCLEPGEYRTDLHSYVYMKTELANLRTTEEVTRLANVARGVIPLLGVRRGQSVLTGHIDLVWGCPIDYMHCVCEGVVKQFADIFFGTPRGGALASADIRSEVDKDLALLEVPHEFQRKPRSLSEIKQWKAQEWRSFLLYSSPLVLAGRIADEAAAHFLCLSVGIYFLTLECCNRDKVLISEALLKNWHYFIGAVVGDRGYTYNAHGVLHLPEQVRRHGPLWTHSAFVYESINCELKKLCSGSTFTAKQIASRFVRSRLVKSDELRLDSQRYLVAGVSEKLVWQTSEQGIFAVGKQKINRTLIQQYSRDDSFLDDGAFACERVVSNKTCYHSRSYKKLGRSSTCSAMVSSTSLIRVNVFISRRDGQLYAAGLSLIYLTVVLILLVS